jgi:hypothetical protein
MDVTVLLKIQKTKSFTLPTDKVETLQPSKKTVLINILYLVIIPPSGVHEQLQLMKKQEACFCLLQILMQRIRRMEDQE